MVIPTRSKNVAGISEDLDRQHDTLLGHLARSNVAHLIERNITKLRDERAAIGRALDALRRGPRGA